MDATILLKGVTWGAIGLCISQSAVFSGMNLEVFSISRLRLEVEVAAGNRNAVKLLALREDANHLLTTILWGNVGVNVLLALLSNSVMTGLVAFLFSTFLITFVGEIFPQAYFSRHALKMAAVLSGLLRFYKLLLYPVAKPTAKILDLWLGKEGIHYFRESDLRQVIKIHMEAEGAEVDHVEGAGALNFLAFDDLAVTGEGEPVDPDSILELPVNAQGDLQFPDFEQSAEDPFIRQVYRSNKRWVILSDPEGLPRLVLDADGFLRATLCRSASPSMLPFCHRPIIVTDPRMTLGEAVLQLKTCPEHPEDDVIDHDIILVWTDIRRVITGADILGRLLRGIASECT